MMLIAGAVLSFRTPHPKVWNHQYQLYQMGGLAEKLGGIIEVIAGQSKITEANVEATLDEVKTILLDADVNLQVTNALISKVKEKAIGMKVESGQKPGDQFISLLAAELVETMGKAQVPLTRRTDGRPNIILMCGLQGAGDAFMHLPTDSTLFPSQERPRLAPSLFPGRSSRTTPRSPSSSPLTCTDRRPSSSCRRWEPESEWPYTPRVRT